MTSGAVTVGRQKLFHQHVLNSSPLKMQINSGSHTTQICSAPTPTISSSASHVSKDFSHACSSGPHVDTATCMLKLY